MSTYKHFDRLCCVVLVFTLLLTGLFMNGEKLGIQKATTVMAYEQTLFDTSKVHIIDIVMDDWETFCQQCTSEEYYNCTVVIDGEAFKNVGIRGKGNTSLTQVASYGNDRYSYKIEFDHYDEAKTYHGLDKLCLNNIIQDNTYMKDYLTYQMMGEMGVAAPLCSYAYITVNGEDWGLYLAVEGVEESFLQRNYGTSYGELYKPDSSQMGGGRGNGDKFDMDQFLEEEEAQEGLTDRGDMRREDAENQEETRQEGSENADEKRREGGGRGHGMMPEERSKSAQKPDGMGEGQMPELPDGMGEGQMPELPDGAGDGQMHGGGGPGQGSDDVLLKYIDDDPDSYSSIFENAKTEVTKQDKTRLIQALKKLSAGEDLEEVVDVEQVISYFVVHNFVLNFDSYTGSMIHNYYLYEQEGQMQMIPWDYNLAFGGFQSMGGATSLVNYPIDDPTSDGSAEERPMLDWIFANESYTQMYHMCFDQFITDYFESGYFETKMEETIALISPYVEKDPTKFCTYEEFEAGVTTLQEFCLLRAESIRGQLDGTIGTTAETQEEETLIQAEDLEIDAMGTMNHERGGEKDLRIPSQ